MKKIALILAQLIIASGLLFIANIEAVSGKTWKQSGFSDFLKGTPIHTAVFYDNKILLAPSYTEIYQVKERPYIWDIILDNQGNIIIGTGTKASVYKINPTGQEIWKKSLDGLQVTALALNKNNEIFVAVSPDGKIYKINTSGDISEYFNTKQKYIWALAIDHKGDLYAATGTKGMIFKITGKEEGSEFTRLDDIQITALVIGPDGNLYGGTDEKGYIFKVDQNGKVFILYDSDEQEVKSILFDREGNLYAATVNRSAVTTEKDLKAGQEKEAEIQIAKDEKSDSKTPAPPTKTIPKPTRAIKGAVYIIYKNGRVENILPSSKTTFYDLALWQDNSILIGTGDEGRLYAYRGPNKTGLIMDLEHKQISSLVTDSGKVYVASSNEAAIYRIEDGYPESGDFYSDILDTGTISSWGIISWTEVNPQNTAIRLSTRSGNTEKPDDSWSDWSPAYLTAAGVKITSPSSRFIQWRASLQSSDKTKTPELRAVNLSYLPMNNPPMVIKFDLLPKGIAIKQRPDLSESDPRLEELIQDQMNDQTAGNGIPKSRVSSKTLSAKKIFMEGAQTFSWDAEDPNGDKLLFSIYYKGDEEQQWKLLEEEIEDQFYTWDTKSVPDGHYQIKIVASDEPDTPPALALTDEFISETFLVDNTGPTISKPESEIKGSEALIKFSVKDNLNPITDCRYSINGEKWIVLFPDDNIGDTLRESYTIKFKIKKGEEYTVVIKARDSDFNYSANSITFKP